MFLDYSSDATGVSVCTDIDITNANAMHLQLCVWDFVCVCMRACVSVCVHSYM